jgi:hypothetical protein
MDKKDPVNKQVEANKRWRHNNPDKYLPAHRERMRRYRAAKKAEKNEQSNG